MLYPRDGDQTKGNDTCACRILIRPVLGKHRLEVTAPKMITRSKHSRRMVPTKRSAMPFARGARTGVLTILTSSAAKTASKEAVNFMSRSRIRNLAAAAYSPSSIEMLRAVWVTQSVTGLAVTPAIRTRRASWWTKKST